MNRSQLYHLSNLVIGLSLGLTGAQAYLSAGGNVGAALLAIGGTVYVAAATTHFVRTDEAEIGGSFWLSVIAAGLCTIGVVLHFLV